MKRFLLLLWMLMWLTSLTAQPLHPTLSGTVRDAATGQPVESAMVMLQNRDGRTMYGYAITQADGCYSISFNSKADTRIYAHPVDAMRESTGQNYLVIITGGRAELVTPSDPVSLWYDPLELE